MIFHDCMVSGPIKLGFFLRHEYIIFLIIQEITGIIILVSFFSEKKWNLQTLWLVAQY